MLRIIIAENLVSELCMNKYIAVGGIQIVLC